MCIVEFQMHHRKFKPITYDNHEDHLNAFRLFDEKAKNHQPTVCNFA